jgi:hypothetical protein
MSKLGPTKLVGWRKRLKNKKDFPDCLFKIINKVSFSYTFSKKGSQGRLP